MLSTDDIFNLKKHHEMKETNRKRTQLRKNGAVNWTGVIERGQLAKLSRFYRFLSRTNTNAIVRRQTNSVTDGQT